MPGGPRLAILGNAGGVNVLAADAAEAAGLVVPAASDGLSRLGASNPLDLGAAATPEAFARSLDQVCASGEFDVLQTDFGIKPFSVALGALEVQDRLHIKFRIVAAKQ